MRCLTCKYDLANLTGRRCPECGKPFDPGNPITFLPTPDRQRLRRRIRIFAVVVAVVSLGNYLNLPQRFVHDGWSLPSQLAFAVFSSLLPSVLMTLLILWLLKRSRNPSQMK